MSYLALYRKYRPNNFKNVVGQDVVVNVLVNAIKSNHISHAYLFTGPRGTGKTSIAKIFAKAVNCTSFTDDLCGECDTCKFIDSNDSDIVEIDAASNNGVDEIRSLRDNVNLMPSFCKYKIYIIDEVHMLSTGAFNALLKTLEEPPSHVIFILATTDSQKIPLTILSRCQRFDFNRVSVPNIVHRLKYILDNEKQSLPDDILNYIASSSDGCLRDAVNLLDQTLSLSKGDNTTFDDIDDLSGKISNETLFSLLNSIIKCDYSNLINLSNSFSSSGKNLVEILDKLLTVVRDISINVNISNYFSSDYSQSLNSFNISKEDIIVLTDLINKAINEIKYSNNQKILFDIYLFQLSNLFNRSSEIKSNDSTVIKEIEVIKEDDKESVSNDKIEANESSLVFNDASDSESVSNESLINKEEEIVSEEESDSLSIKDIRINNALATADKKCLMDIKKDMSTLDEYMTNKKYVGLVDLLSDCEVVVASTEYLLFSTKDLANVSIFDSNLSKIESLFKQAFGKTYRVVCVDDNHWKDIKNEYIRNLKNKVSYTIIDENVVKLDVKPKKDKTIDSASSIFGDNLINLK